MIGAIGIVTTADGEIEAKVVAELRPGLYKIETAHGDMVARKSLGRLAGHFTPFVKPRKPGEELLGKPGEPPEVTNLREIVAGMEAEIVSLGRQVVSLTKERDEVTAERDAYRAAHPTPDDEDDEESEGAPAIPE